MKMVGALVLAVAASFVLGGCFSVEVASSPCLGEGVEKHVLVRNYGWYLFGCVPLACGNARLDSWCPFSVLCDEVQPSIVHEKLKDVVNKHDCKIVDFHIIDDDDVLFEAYYITLPWVVVRKDVSISANLVKNGGVQ